MSEQTPEIAKPTFEAYDQTFTIARKPGTFLLAALSRTQSGDPEAVGVLYEFFEVVLDGDDFRRFRKAAYMDEDTSGETLAKAMSDVLSRTIAEVPTK